jgi:glycosyltransferase involved in cell wall biosynthesis
LCIDYPVYREINEQLPIAVLVEDTSAANLAEQLNNLLHNEVLHKELQANCIKAREIYNWQKEEKKLVEFYNQLLAN